MKRFILIPIIFLVCICYSQNIIYVNEKASGTRDGHSWENAFVYIQNAVNSALPGDEIRVAEGEYNINHGEGIPSGSRSVSLTITDRTRLMGGYNPQTGARDPEMYPTHIVGIISDGMVWQDDRNMNTVTFENCGNGSVLDGFILNDSHANGSEDFNGAALYMFGSSGSIRNCSFSGNEAHSFGGAVYCRDCDSVHFENCVFENNKAHAGGAIYICYSTRMRISRSKFRGNRSNYSGAVHLWDASLRMDNCLLSGNRAEYTGGCLMIEEDSDLILDWVTAASNSAYLCGAIEISNNDSGYCEIRNSVIWNNISETSEPQISYSGILKASCCNIQSCNCSNDGDFLWNSDFGEDGGGNMDCNPCFRSPSDPVSAPDTAGDYHLSFGSPCIASGSSPENECFDLDGQPRIMPVFAEKTDLGAYEFRENEQALPVKLMDISAVAEKTSWRITWRSGSETENLGYLVEYSSDRKIWIKADDWMSCTSLQGKGSCSEITDYNYVLSPAWDSIRYVRLSSVSYAGAMTSLSIIKLKKNEKSMMINDIRPNPFNPETVIDFTLNREEFLSLKIFDSRGSQVMCCFTNTLPKGSHSFTFNGQGLSAGIYFAVLEGKNEKNCRKMLLLP